MRLEVLEKDCCYHIYNRGINGCKIFNNSSNYKYFIKLFIKYLSPHVSVFAYCLLNNHFHFVIQVNDKQNIVSQKFSNFFNAYAKAFNKENYRTGSLFEKPFKRIKLQSNMYLKNLIIYVHTNPVKHRLFADFKGYSFSSYLEIVNSSSIFINSKEVIELFHDIENFIFVHNRKSILLSVKYILE